MTWAIRVILEHHTIKLFCWKSLDENKGFTFYLKTIQLTWNIKHYKCLYYTWFCRVRSVGEFAVILLTSCWHVIHYNCVMWSVMCALERKEFLIYLLLFFDRVLCSWWWWFIAVCFLHSYVKTLHAIIFSQNNDSNH